MEIKGNTALITGGASGLGAATTRALHGSGANVLIVDLNDELGETLVSELGNRAAYAHANVVNPEEMSAAVAVAVSRFGKLHFAVNCAGVGQSARVLGREGPMALEYFSTVVNVNLIGTFNAIRLSAEPMAKNDPNAEGERGVIVNTASVAAFEGQIGQAPYSASKGGIVGMTLPIAREFAQHGIRVMTIAPGLFDTPLLGRLPQAAKDSLGAQVPFPRRLGDPREFAALVRHIIESPMLNGETIRLDGAIRMAPR